MQEPLRILMIEDSDTDAELIEHELSRSNLTYTLRRLVNPEEFETELDQYKPHLILSDYRVPRFEPLKAVRVARLKYPDVPFIFVSGTIGEDLAIETVKNGATDYVLKDKLFRLIPAINRALQEAEQKAERKQAQDRLRLLQRAVENMQLGVTVTDLNGRIIFTNSTEAGMHGYKIDDLIGKDARVFAPRELWKELSFEELRQMKSWKRETINVKQDGHIFPVQISSDVVTDKNGNPVGVVNITEDLTDLQMSQHAFVDNLTRLPSRALFLDRVGRAIKRIKRKTDYAFALFYVDIDHFKKINEAMGYQTGDSLLVACARRLEACLRFADTVARLGGNEFAVLLEDLKDPEEAMSVADRIQRQLSAPFNISGHEIYIRTSIGIVFGTSMYDRAEEVLRDASTALYRAKALGRNRYEIFDRILQSRGSAPLPLEAGLKRALEENELVLYYQPIVSLRTGKITGAEALLRWEHPNRGLVYPHEFIPIAEETTLIAPIGEWVIRTACRQSMAWQEAGLPELTVAVNVSAKQLDQRDLIPCIARILAEMGLPPHLLELELTENLLLENAEKTLQLLAALKALGIRLAIDDFGTGYSSLGYLKRFYIDTLKIDQSFVRDISRNAKDEAIATAVISLAHSLRLHVIAEGVETEEQLTFLRTHDCDAMQGNYFSRALPPQEFEQFLRNGHSLPLLRPNAPAPTAE